MVDFTNARELRSWAAHRVQDLAPSGTMAVSQRVRDLLAQGISVINMGGGDPDFATPPHIVEAAIRSLQSGATHYVESPGLLKLRQAIADKLSRENGVYVSPVGGLVVTPGAKFAVLLALMSHLNRGDEVLIPQPSWVSYNAMVRLAEGLPIPVLTLPEDGFRIAEDALERAITRRTRAIIANHPVNPTGHLLDGGEIAAIGAVAERWDLLVISDEIYEGIRLRGRPHESLASRPDLASRTLTINGFSKTYAMTGWRLGYVAGPDRLIVPLRRVQQHSIHCVAPFIQEAGVAALTGPQDCLMEMRAQYQERQDAFVQAVRGIRGVQVTRPDATFYMFPRFDIPGVGAPDLANQLLEVGGVAATAGTEFGATGQGHVRFSLRVPAEVMPRVADGIRKTLASLSA